MKTIMLIMMVFVMSVQAQVNTPCLTMEQTNAQNAQYKANAIVVCDTSSQQMQTYYQQLATYWQQLHKDKQQIDKDAQQIAKDKQQMEKDAQQIECDKVLSEKAACLNTKGYGYDEIVCFIEVVVPYCSKDLKKELERIKNKRCGIPEVKNPKDKPSKCPINGFDNPAYTICK